MKKRLLLVLIALVLFSWSNVTFARDVSQITDWYIKHFSSDITVARDGSVTITEKILADCGNLPNKHGIFRVLPTFYQETFFRRIPAPVTLLSIKDPEGNNYQYEEIPDTDSVTWKIGDPYQTVTGEHEYIITYKVANAIRTRGALHDELYWNLNGNFWEIETDAFDTTIHFPADVPQALANTDYYIGLFGETTKEGMRVEWKDPRTLFVTTGPLYVEEGATISVLLPKGMIRGATLTWSQMYGQWSWYFVPVVAFFFCLIVWLLFGNDRPIRKSIVPEYGPSAGWDVMELSVINSGGKFDSKAVTAAILSLATRKVLAIEDIDTTTNNWSLRKLAMPTKETLSVAEKILMGGLFKTGPIVTISDLKNVFHTTVTKISAAVNQKLIDEGVFTNAGKVWTMVLGIGCWVSIIFMTLAVGSIERFLIFLVTAAIFFIFAIFMPKLTAKGLEIKWQLKGFALFMKTAEHHRQVFMEKEGMFEKLLPYAVILGLVKHWVQAMQEIYGEKAAAHTRVYWGGTASALAFGSVDNFTQNLQSLTTHMSSTMVSRPSSSGSRGGGSSGGGGGGGGGGGW